MFVREFAGRRVDHPNRTQHQHNLSCGEVRHAHRSGGRRVSDDDHHRRHARLDRNDGGKAIGGCHTSLPTVTGQAERKADDRADRGKAADTRRVLGQHLWQYGRDSTAERIAP